MLSRATKQFFQLENRHLRRRWALDSFCPQQRKNADALAPFAFQVMQTGGVFEDSPLASGKASMVDIVTGPAFGVVEGPIRFQDEAEHLGVARFLIIRMIVLGQDS